MAPRSQPGRGPGALSDRALRLVPLTAVGQPLPGVVWKGKGYHTVQAERRAGRERCPSWAPAWTVFPLKLRAGEVSFSGHVSLSDKGREGRSWEQIRVHSNDFFVAESEFTEKCEGGVT